MLYWTTQEASWYSKKALELDTPRCQCWSCYVLFSLLVQLTKSWLFKHTVGAIVPSPRSYPHTEIKIV